MNTKIAGIPIESQSRVVLWGNGAYLGGVVMGIGRYCEVISSFLLFLLWIENNYFLFLLLLLGLGISSLYLI